MNSSMGQTWTTMESSCGLAFCPVQGAHMEGIMGSGFSVSESAPHLLVISLTHCPLVTCSLVDTGTFPVLSFGQGQAPEGPSRDRRE